MAPAVNCGQSPGYSGPIAYLLEAPSGVCRRVKRSIVPDAARASERPAASMRNRQNRPAEYRERAAAAATLATDACLANVREKHERAAATWLALAEMDEQPSTLAPSAALR